MLMSSILFLHSISPCEKQGGGGGLENSAQDPQFPVNPKKHSSAKQLFTNWFLRALAATRYAQITTLTAIVPLVIIAVLARA